jgi:hypothetical protein
VRFLQIASLVVMIFLLFIYLCEGLDSGGQNQLKCKPGELCTPDDMISAGCCSCKLLVMLW